MRKCPCCPLWTKWGRVLWFLADQCEFFNVGNPGLRCAWHQLCGTTRLHDLDSTMIEHRHAVQSRKPPLCCYVVQRLWILFSRRLLSTANKSPGKNDTDKGRCQERSFLRESKFLPTYKTARLYATSSSVDQSRYVHIQYTDSYKHLLILGLEQSNSHKMQMVATLNTSTTTLS